MLGRDDGGGGADDMDVVGDPGRGGWGRRRTRGG
jgi:hypothetical protein